jgi:hypothetical protein
MRYPVYLAVMLLSLAGCCKRYEDGPGLSLRSKTERLCNSWRVEGYFVNGSDQSRWFHDNYPGYRELFNKDNTYKRHVMGIQAEGTWAFFDHKNQVIVGTPGSTFEVVLLRLKEKELWYYRLEGNNTLEYHLVPE